ncbi:MAG TPA: hypothetical protein VFQ91_04760 [Bryobacteraceae bacterium]|nr:hypothetical protein [Bryobacteraceae bacterium]
MSWLTRCRQQWDRIYGSWDYDGRTRDAFVLAKAEVLTGTQADAKEGQNRNQQPCRQRTCFD